MPLAGTRTILLVVAMDLTGRVLGGRYRLERRLRAGGMGTLYEATQIDLGRRVAVKVLLSHLDSPADLARFEREAKSAAALGNPHIVAITDFQRPPNEPPFLVMELVQGRSVGDLLRESGTLPPARVVHIAVQVLSALSAAHGAGIVHRDIKPDNVMVTTSATGDLVKVVDFGIARPIEKGGAEITAHGFVIGTATYMSPEQARGEQIDGRADLWAVATVMYVALAGQHPLPAKRGEEMLALLRNEPVPIERLRPDLDPRLAAVVMRGLSRAPAQRYATADEMIEALQGIFGSGAFAIAQPTGPHRPREVVPASDATPTVTLMAPPTAQAPAPTAPLVAPAPAEGAAEERPPDTAPLPLASPAQIVPAPIVTPAPMLAPAPAWTARSALRPVADPGAMSRADTLATLSVGVALLGFLLALFPPVGFVSAAAVALGIRSRALAARAGGRPPVMATAGIVLGALATSLGALLWWLW